MEKAYLYLEVATWIISYIKEHNLKVGDRLPSERELAGKMNVSRSSIREAARVLEGRHIIDVRLGSGMFVMQDADSEVYSIDLRKVNYTELLDIKMLLEFQIIQQLCKSASDADLQYLEEPLLIMEDDARNGKYVIAHDNVFHSRIRRLAENQTMAQLIENLVIELDEYADGFRQMYQIWLDTVPLHRKLLEAIRAKDIEEANLVYGQMKEMDLKAIELCFPGTPS